MNSILKIFFRQTEHLLHLTKTSIHAYQLQNNFVNENIIKDNHQCSFSYDLCHELQLIQKYLYSTCFLLQRALYRVQALRQIRGELAIEIDDEIIFNYQQNLSWQLNQIQSMIRLIIDENMLMNSPLNSLQILFKEIEENFSILLDWMPKRRSTIYLGNIVSDTLERFYLILDALIRLAMDIRTIRNKNEK